MPGASKNTKIYKLKATDGPLSRDDVSTWIFTVKSFARQNTWSNFLPTGANKYWTCTDDDENNGMTVNKADGSVDVDESNKLRENFQDFLTAVAANCPAGFTETVIRESTSFQWIVEKINKTFNLTTKGENFLDGMNLKFEFDDSFTYQQAWMMLKDKYIPSLLPSQSQYMGKTLQAKETISPLAMNFLVREWLQKIDLRLPEHVRTSRGHLFTAERPTLACNQQILCDQIDIMLQELEGKEASNSNINVGYVPTNRGRGFGRPRPTGPPAFRSRQTYRQRGGPPRLPQPGRRPTYSCQLCLEARPPRYDSSITHPSHECPFPGRQRVQTRQQTPQFKVLLVPTQSQDDHSNTDALVNQFENASLNNQAAPHSYSAEDQFYQEEHDDQSYNSYSYDDQYYDPPGYERGTLREIPL